MVADGLAFTAGGTHKSKRLIAASLSLRHPTFKHGFQLIHVHRFGQVVIHSCGDTSIGFTLALHWR